MSRFVKAYLKAKRLNERKTPLPWTPKFLETSKEPSIPFPLRERKQPQRVDLAKHLNIKEGDLVQVMYGRDFNRQGTILKINRRRNTAIVEGCNIKRCFWSVNKGGPSLTSEELPIHLTNLALLDPIAKRPTRVKRRYMMNGECVRISKVSGCAMPEPLTPLPRPSNAYQQYLKEKAKGPPIKEEYANPDPVHMHMLRQLAFGFLNSSKLYATPVAAAAAAPAPEAAAAAASTGDGAAAKQEQQ